jgi:TrmH family RNA methyltransferase
VTEEIASRLRRVASRENALVKQLRRAFTQGELSDDGHCAIESVRVVEEAIRSGLRFKAVFFAESAQQRAERLLPQLSAQTDAVLLSDDVFRSAVATESPQGVAALVKLKHFSIDDVLTAPDPLVVGVAGVQDPGNLGTILRSAEAFGAVGVLIGEGTVSPFNPKVVRAAAGSLFRLPVIAERPPRRHEGTETFEKLLEHVRERGLRMIATSSHKARPVSEVDLRGPLCLLIGNEGAGVPRELLKQADETVMIPHSTKVESLNAGVAASVLLYEIARQRSTSTTETRRHGEG